MVLSQHSSASEASCNRTSDMINKHLVPCQYMYSTVKLHCGGKTHQLALQSFSFILFLFLSVCIKYHVCMHTALGRASKLSCLLSPERNTRDELKKKTTLCKHTQHHFLLDCKAVIWLWVKHSLVSAILYRCRCAQYNYALCACILNICFILFMGKILLFATVFVEISGYRSVLGVEINVFSMYMCRL